MLSNVLLKQLNELRLNSILCDLELVARDESTFHVHQIVFIALNQRHFQLALKNAENQSDLALHKKMYLGSLTAEELKLLVEFMYGSTVTQKSKYDSLVLALGKVDMAYLLEEAGEFTLEDDTIPIKTEDDLLPSDASTLVISGSTEQRQNVGENNNEERISGRCHQVDCSLVVSGAVEVKQEPLYPENSSFMNKDSDDDELEKSLSEALAFEAGAKTDTIETPENTGLNVSKHVNSDSETNQLCKIGEIVGGVKVEINSNAENTSNFNDKYTEIKSEGSLVLSQGISSEDRCMQRIDNQRSRTVTNDSIAEMPGIMQVSCSTIEETTSSGEITSSSPNKMRKLLPKPVVYVYSAPPSCVFKAHSSSSNSKYASRTILPTPVCSVASFHSPKTSPPTLTSSVEPVTTLNSTGTSPPSVVSTVVSVSSLTSTIDPRNVPPFDSEISKTPSSVVTSGSQTYSEVHSKTISASSTGLTATVRTASQIDSAKSSKTFGSTTKSDQTTAKANTKTPEKLLKRRPLFKKSKRVQKRHPENYPNLVHALEKSAKDLKSCRPESPVFEKDDGTESNDLNETDVLVESAATFLKVKAVAAVKIETDNNNTCKSDTLVTDRNKDANNENSKELSSVGVLNRSEESSSEAIENSDTPIESESQKCNIPSSEILTLTYDDIKAAKQKRENENNPENNSGNCTPDRGTGSVMKKQVMNRQVLKNGKCAEKHKITSKDTKPPANLTPSKLSSRLPQTVNSTPAKTEISSVDLGRIESIQKSTEIFSVKIVSGKPKNLEKLFKSSIARNKREEHKQIIDSCNHSKRTDNIKSNENINTKLKEKISTSRAEVGERHNRETIYKENHSVKVLQNVKSVQQSENTDKHCAKVAMDSIYQVSLTKKDKKVSQNEDLQRTEELLENDAALSELALDQSDDIDSSEKTKTDKEIKHIDKTVNREDAFVFVNKPEEKLNASFNDFLTPLQESTKRCIIPLSEICTLPPLDFRPAFEQKAYTTVDTRPKKSVKKANEKSLATSVPRSPNDISITSTKVQQKTEKGFYRLTFKNFLSKKPKKSKFKETKDQCSVNGKETADTAERKSLSGAAHLENQKLINKFGNNKKSINMELDTTDEQSDVCDLAATEILGNMSQMSESSEETKSVMHMDEEKCSSKVTSEENQLFIEIINLNDTKSQISEKEVSDNYSNSNISRENKLLTATDGIHDNIKVVQHCKTALEEMGSRNDINGSNAEVGLKEKDKSDASRKEREAMQELYASEPYSFCQDEGISESAKVRNFPEEVQKNRPSTINKSYTNSRSVLPEVTVIRFPIAMKIAGKPVSARFLNPNYSENAVMKDKVDESEEKRKRHKSLQDCLSSEKGRKFKRLKRSYSPEHTLPKGQINCKSTESKRKRSLSGQTCGKTSKEKRKSATVDNKSIQRQVENRYVIEEEVTSDEQNDNDIEEEDSDADADIPLSQLKEKIESAKLSNCDLSNKLLLNEGKSIFETELIKDLETDIDVVLMESKCSGHGTSISTMQSGSVEHLDQVRITSDNIGEDRTQEDRTHKAKALLQLLKTKIKVPNHDSTSESGIKNCDELIKDQNYEKNQSWNMINTCEKETVLAANVANLRGKQNEETDTASESEIFPVTITENMDFRKKQNAETDASCNSKSSPVTKNEHMDDHFNFKRKQNEETGSTSEPESSGVTINQDVHIHKTPANYKNMNNDIVVKDDSYLQKKFNADQEGMSVETDADKAESVIDLTLTDDQGSRLVVDLTRTEDQCSKSVVDLTTTEDQSFYFSLGIPGVIQENTARNWSISDTTPVLKKALTTELTGSNLDRSGKTGKPTVDSNSVTDFEPGLCHVCGIKNCFIDSEESGLCYACSSILEEQMDMIEKDSENVLDKQMDMRAKDNEYSKDQVTNISSNLYMKYMKEKHERAKNSEAIRRKRSLKRRKSHDASADKSPTCSIPVDASSAVMKNSCKSTKETPYNELQCPESVSVPNTSQLDSEQSLLHKTIQTVDVGAVQSSASDIASTPSVCQTVSTKKTSSLSKQSTFTTYRRPVLPKVSPVFVSSNRVGVMIQDVLSPVTMSSVKPSVNLSAEKSTASTTVSYTVSPDICSTSYVLSPANSAVSTMMLPTTTSSTAVLSTVKSPVLSPNTRFGSSTTDGTSPVLKSVLNSKPLVPVPRLSVLILKSTEDVQKKKHSSLERSKKKTVYRKLQPKPKGFFHPPFS